MKSQVYSDIYDHELRHWWYRVRRSLAQYLIMHYAPKQSTKKLEILDVGCGTGGLMKELAEWATVTGVDMSNEAIAFCTQRGIQSVRVGDATRLPFASDSFDVVVALDVLEHIDDDLQAAKEIRRVLRENGIFVAFVPAFMFLWGSTDEAGNHKRRYTRQSIFACLEAGGLRVVRSSYFNTLLFIPIAAMRLFARLLRRNIVDEFDPGDRTMNRFLFRVFSFETFLLRYLSFPFGVSVFTVCTKDK